MKVQEILQKTTQFFKNKGVASARLDTELLLSKALGWSRVDLYLKGDYPVNDEELNKCRELVRRRASGEPVAYIFAEKEFYGRSFEVNREVLIPRPETEHVADEALQFARTEAATRLIDLGTGSGCIGLTLLCELPDAQLVTVDISPGAMAVAERNAQLLQVRDRVQFLTQPAEQLNLAQVEALLGGPADVVAGNPPYIAPDDPQVDVNVRKFEPGAALFSDDNGLSHIHNWLAVAAQLLRPCGLCVFEIGSGQGRRVVELAQEHFAEIRIVKDYSGHDRVVHAVKRGN